MMPTVGRIVHYKLESGRSKGQVRPAEIVRVWSERCVNLLVKLDGGNDAGAGALDSLGNDPLLVWKTSVLLAPSGTEGTDESVGQRFWPPRAA